MQVFMSAYVYKECLYKECVYKEQTFVYQSYTSSHGRLRMYKRKHMCV